MLIARGHIVTEKNIHSGMPVSIVLPLLSLNPNIFIGPPIFSVLFVQWLVKSPYSLPLKWASQVALGVKNPPVNAEDAGDARETGWIPGSGRSFAEGNGNPLQYSYLENSMNTGAWRAIVHGVAKSWTWLSTRGTSISEVVSTFFLGPAPVTETDLASRSSTA